MTRPGKTVQINVSIPRDLDAKLKELAEADNRSLSNYIANLLRQAVDKEGA